MKRFTAMLLGLVLALIGVGAAAEGMSFDRIAGLEWTFSSGVGGWGTELYIAEDGTFSGEFHDSEMGEVGTDYPNGTIYYCAFTGALSIVEQVDEHTWKLRVDSLNPEDRPGEESLGEGVRLIATEPYGLSAADEMLLFLPGTPTDALTEDMRMWAHLTGDDAPDVLADWFMYSAKNESGFVGYRLEDESDISNPWAEMTEAEFAKAAGVTLNLPKGAEDALYRWNEVDSLAEMQFTLDGDEYCARVQPAELEDGALLNISDIYFDWEHEEEITVGPCPGTIGLAKTGSTDWVELCLWYDAAPGLMYALSVYTTDPDGLDLTAVAQMVYAPVQADA